MSPPDLLERKKGYSRYFEEPLIDKHSRGSHSREDKGTKFTKNHQQKIKNTIVEYRVYMEQRIKNIHTNSKYSNIFKESRSLAPIYKFKIQRHN